VVLGSCYRAVDGVAERPAGPKTPSAARL